MLIGVTPKSNLQHFSCASRRRIEPGRRIAETDFFRNKRLGGKAHGSNATPTGGLHHQDQGSVQFS